MALSHRDPFEDNSAHLKTFPDHALLDIARNDAAQKPYRLLAVEILQARNSPKIKHPDIQHLVQELEIELDGIVFEHPAPSGPGPLTSGITTAILYGTDEVDNSTTDILSTEPETTTQTLSEGDRIIVDVPAPVPTLLPVEPKPKRTYTRKPKEPDVLPPS